MRIFEIRLTLRERLLPGTALSTMRTRVMITRANEGLTMSGFDDDVGNVPLLQGRIVALSTAENFASARLHEIELATHMVPTAAFASTGLKNCVKNTLNGNVALLGNVCVNRFIGIPSALVFHGLKRIVADRTAAPNQALAVFAPRLRDRERLGISLPEQHRAQAQTDR